MHKKTDPKSAAFRLTGRAGKVSLAVAASVLITLGTVAPGVMADQYDEQIKALQQQNAATQTNVDALQAQSNSYQDAISRLQSQIDALQAQITANQAEQAALQQQITEKQAEIDRERVLLGDDIKAMYVDGDMTTVEMLATSKNLSEYVDKQEYRNAVQKNIQDALQKIAKLQNELKQKKAEIDQLIANQQVQQNQLSADRTQQADMLAYTEAQKAQYNSQIASNNSQIAELRREQIIANSRYTIGAPGTGVNCGGGYPGKWCEVPQDSVGDSWGMYNRECVSYAAFKVHMDFLAGRDSHDMPYWGGYDIYGSGTDTGGNARQWVNDARYAGIPYDYNPTPGSIAISTAGAYGHAMYVEQVGTVNGQQAIYVSQYNQQLDGRYSEQWRYTTGLTFLHF